jgi:hypothetical protein
MIFQMALSGEHNYSDSYPRARIVSVPFYGHIKLAPASEYFSAVMNPRSQCFCAIISPRKFCEPTLQITTS